MTTPRRLFFDIETSPNIGLFWSAGYKLNIAPENIIKERAIICICYKWQGQDKTYSLQWDSKQDDKKMLTEFIKIANDSDELVGHNGDKYDMAFIRTRCLFHGIEMFPSYDTIDTLKHSRSKFRFNSNKLDYIAQYLGVGAKIKTTYNLWKDIVLEKDKEAMAQMIEYCKVDVEILERVYLKMQGHIAPRLHHGMLNGGKKHSCPECGSTDLGVHRKRVSVSGYPKFQMKCNVCYKFHTISGSNLKHYIE